LNISKTLKTRAIVWAICAGTGWLLLWLAPWQDRLSFSNWIRLGGALIIFIIPGLCIYGLISTTSTSLPNYLTFGFVISHLILAIVGTLGRYLHFSFDVLKNIVMGGTFILVICFGIFRMPSIRWRFSLSIIQDILSYWPLALTIVLTTLMTIQRVLSDDDLTYLAYITNWRNSPALNFNDIFFGADKLTALRFWLISSPFSQAFLSKLSDIPGIFILGGYYEPFLVGLSLFSFYGLARETGLSHRKSMLAVVFQVLFMALLSEYLHPGAPFFRQLSTDKATAAFIFTPVFLQSVFWYLHNPGKGKLALVILTGASLTIMHPVIFVYALIIAGLVTVFGIERSNVATRGLLVLALIMVMLPQVGIRFVRTEAAGVIPYTTEDILNSGGIENLIAFWPNTPFYGFNPAILGMHIPFINKLPIIYSFIWLIIPLACAAIAIKHIRHNLISQYMLACFLLGTLAGIPFTGWLLGYIVSAWMLERALWLYPFGIGMVYLMISLDKKNSLTNRLLGWMSPLHSLTKIARRHWLMSILTLLLTIPLLIIMREQGLPNLKRFESNNQRYQEFTQIGAFMDEHTTDLSIAAGTDELNDYIPSISAKVKLISYRPSDTSYPYFFSMSERNQRLHDQQAIFSRDVSIEDRIRLIQKYNIQFLWLKGGEYYKVKDMLLEHPELFIEHHIERYYVIEVRR